MSMSRFRSSPFSGAVFIRPSCHQDFVSSLRNILIRATQSSCLLLYLIINRFTTLATCSTQKDHYSPMKPEPHQSINQCNDPFIRPVSTNQLMHDPFIRPVSINQHKHAYYSITASFVSSLPLNSQSSTSSTRYCIRSAIKAVLIHSALIPFFTSITSKPYFISYDITDTETLRRGIKGYQSIK